MSPYVTLERIDGVVALIMAMKGIRMKIESAYDVRGTLILYLCEEIPDVVIPQYGIIIE